MKNNGFDIFDSNITFFHHFETRTIFFSSNYLIELSAHNYKCKENLLMRKKFFKKIITVSNGKVTTCYVPKNGNKMLICNTFVSIIRFLIKLKPNQNSLLG